MNTFTAPKIEYGLLSPLLIVLTVAVLGVLVEAALPRGRRYLTQSVLALVGLVAALVATILVAGKVDLTGSAPGRVAAEGALAIDGPTIVTWALTLVFGLLGLCLFAERHLEGGVLSFAGQAAALPGTEAEREASTRGLEHTEVFPLMLFAIAGMLIFPAANDLLTMFVGLEVLSLPLYLLCGLARRRRLLSQEAALKYFMLGAFSSGFFVYGIALVYGFSGSMELAGIAEAVSGRTTAQPLLLGGMGLMAVGLLFKVGAAPFHSWTPDVYQGAPTAVTGFMAAATKVAAFGAMLRLFYVAFGGARWDWLPLFAGVALLTMAVGSIVAIRQNDAKRLLAYSSIAHAGFLMVGVLGIRSLNALQNGEVSAVQAVLFYLITYGLATMAAFGIVTLVRDGGSEVGNMAQWAGLGKRSPLVAGAFSFLLLSLAGIPLTGGFTGKWAVFTAALSAGMWWVVVAAVLFSVVAAAFYVRVIRLMFFTDPLPDGPSVAVPSVLTGTVIALGTAATLVLGVVPGIVLDRLGDVAQFIR